MQTTGESNELLQCFDEYRNPTDVRPRVEVKMKPHCYWYGVTKIWIVNDKNEILCTKRSDFVVAHPGKWQSYVGGHVSAGDTLLSCAVKEIGEEVGILAQESDLTLLDEGRNDENKNFYAFYAMRCDRNIADLQFVDRETAEAKWMSLEKYFAEIAAHPDDWCNGITPERQGKLRAWMSR